MEKLLVLDTSHRYLAVGLATPEKIIVSTQYEAWQKQSELLMQEVQKAFQMAQWNPLDITRIAVTTGPGSYTGVRIALTSAKVFASLGQIPLVAISSLQALAGPEGKKIVLLDARGQRAYVGLYNNGRALRPDAVLSIDDIRGLQKAHPDFSLVGDSHLLGVASEPPLLVSHLVTLGFQGVPVAHVDQLKPLYLKD